MNGQTREMREIRKTKDLLEKKRKKRIPRIQRSERPILGHKISIGGPHQLALCVWLIRDQLFSFPGPEQSNIPAR